jgi:predicted GTPase
MRIHHLTIQGFGPFKDKQEIDFDALSQDKIFMLEGPTGAGKSSIIDAIVDLQAKEFVAITVKLVMRPKSVSSSRLVGLATK